MGATGSAYFEKWMSSDNEVCDKYTVLEEKLNALEQKHEQLIVQMKTTVSEMATRIDTVEKRASTMIFQEEPDCDIVIIA